MRCGRAYPYLFLFFIAFAFPLLSATDVENPTSSLHASLRELCAGVTGTLPSASMVMVLAGSVIYIAGQAMGSETRARANVWATAAVTGATLGLITTAVTPGVLETIYGADVNCASSGSHGSFQFCGHAGENCCTPGNTCNSGLFCDGSLKCSGDCGNANGAQCCTGNSCPNAPGLYCAGSMCSSQCGNSNQPCCDVSPCISGLFCGAGLCRSCGNLGESCCTTGSPCNSAVPRIACDISSSQCRLCGANPGDICCATAPLCSAVGTTCDSRTSPATCAACGAPGQLCCGTNCTDSGYSCQSGRCDLCGQENQACCPLAYPDNCNSTNASRPLTCSQGGNCIYIPLVCGGAGEDCCNGTMCNAGLSCNTTAAIPTCYTCGGDGQPCCGGTTCNSPFLCNSTSKRCYSIPCGAVGQQCCQPGDSCDTGNVCQSGLCAVQPPPCGGIGQPCCGNTTCTANSTTCFSGTCQSCGTAAGQPCCAGISCTAPLACNSTSKLCYSCGGAAQPCCSGNTCTAAGVACNIGTQICQACGGAGQPCCNGTTCTASGYTCNTTSRMCATCGAAIGQSCCGANGSQIVSNNNYYCNPASLACSNGGTAGGACSHCGASGEICCGNGTLPNCNYYYIDNSYVCGTPKNCGSGMGCYTPTGPLLPGYQYMHCYACGGANQSCCANNVCNLAGYTCNAVNGTCQACGGAGQPCCGTTCNSGLSCNTTPVIPVCYIPCGGAGQPCCSNNTCTAAGYACNIGTQICQTCGGAGQPCCATGTACTSLGYTCNSGTQMCSACGGAVGQSCCGANGSQIAGNNNYYCNPATLACSNGGVPSASCAHCGASGEMCCGNGTLPNCNYYYMDNSYICGTPKNCGSGMGCYTPTGPLLPGYQYMHCYACGGANQSCCANNVCNLAGYTCNAVNGTCQACGGVNQPCCGTTCNSGLSCNTTPVVPVCYIPCGNLSQPCCSNNTCTASGVACNIGTQICQTCGGANQPCCNGTTCTALGQTCNTASKMCMACGNAVGQPCCGQNGSQIVGNNNYYCAPGSLVCSNGGYANATCAHCGASGEMCCGNSSLPTCTPFYNLNNSYICGTPAICSGALGCYTPTGPVQPGYNYMYCYGCGGANQPCCANSTCTTNGYACNTTAQTCQLCGAAAGQLCCLNRTSSLFNNCTNTTLACNSTPVVPICYSTQLECGILSTPNKQYNMTKSLTVIGSCFNVTAPNVTLNCNGYTITGSNAAGSYGVHSNQQRTRINNCIISNFYYSINFNGATYGTINRTSVSSAGYGIYFYTSSYNTIANSVATAYSSGISLFSSPYNTIANSASTSTSSYGILLSSSSNNNIVNSTGTSTATSSFGIYLASSNSNAIANSTGVSNSYMAIYAGSSNYNNFTRNTFVSGASQYTAYLDSGSANNRFALNNFSTATSSYYINDVSGGNFYNATINGINQGNIYPNVLSGAVAITGTANSSIPGLYVGSAGAGVPYNNANSGGKVTSNVVDYAPLTPTLMVCGGFGQPCCGAGVSSYYPWRNVATATPTRTTGWPYIMGYTFTPALAGSATELCTNTGPGTYTVKIWNSAYSELGSASVTTTSGGSWACAALGAPIALSAGQTYYVGTCLGATDSIGYYSSPSSTMPLVSRNGSANVTIQNSFYYQSNGCTLSGITGTATGTLYGQSDFKFQAGAPSTCNSGYACASGTCQVCGGANQPCCSNNTCTANGYACNTTAQLCRPCGAAGQLCCLNTTSSQFSNCTNSTLYCNTTEIPQPVCYMKSLECGALSAPNTVYNMTKSLNSTGTCFTITASNVTLNCNGFSITGGNAGSSYGVFSNQQYTKINNCVISGFERGVYFQGATYGTINRTTASNTAGSYYPAGICLNGSSYNTISYSTASSTAYNAILIGFGSSSNTFINSTATSSSGIGINIWSGANNNNITNSTASSVSAYSSSGNRISGSRISGPLQLQASGSNTVFNSTIGGVVSLDPTSGSNTIANCTITSSGYGITVQSGSNTIANSTISGASSSMLITGSGSNNNILRNTFISGASQSAINMGTVSGNIFALNNFTTVTSSYYFYNPSGSNSFNAVVDGANQGNLYPNVMTGAVEVTGTVNSSVPGLYIGSAGAGFPYNPSTSGGKMYGATDYAPLTPTRFSCGYWTARTGAGSRQWRAFASSSDGTKLAAAAYGGGAGDYIFTSADGGATWTQRTSAGNKTWSNLVSSSDGTKLAAVGYPSGGGGQYVWTSWDSGATWTQRQYVANCGGLSMSADGTKLAVSTNGFGSWTSSDSGATWQGRSGWPSSGFQAIASSADGAKLAAGQWPGPISTSTNGGLNWTVRTGAGSRTWSAIASSADGNKLVAGTYPGYIYTSTDGGATWIERTGAGSNYWYSLSSSDDGTRLAANTQSGVYFSNDSGATWARSSGSPSGYGGGMKSDGTKYVAGSNPGYIYTYTNTCLDSMACGGTGQACCGGNTCSSGLNCVSGGGCQCGGFNQLCCGGSSCNSGYSCNGGICRCSGRTTGQPCCPDNTCDSGYTCESSVCQPVCTWVQYPTGSTLQWDSLQSSTNGMSLIGEENMGFGAAKFYYSTNGGASWSSRPGYTGGVAITPSGSTMVTASWMGPTYISTNSGMSWTASRTGYHRGVAVSSNGMRLALAECGLYCYGDYIHTSTDGGSTWTAQTGAGNRAWTGIVSSSDGMRLAARGGGGFYTSTDGGATMTQRTVGGSSSITNFATDGASLYAIGGDGKLYVSSDWTTTWAQRGTVPSGGYSLSVSSDGSRIAAISNYKVVTSSDGGWTWATDRCVLNPATVAVSGDGSRLIAINGSGSPSTYYAQVRSFG